MPRLLFKGGTSLSKCFGLIHRFSEDIDLGLEREDIGLGGDLDPLSKSSRKGYQRAVKAMTVATTEYVSHTLLPALERDFYAVLESNWGLRLEVNGSENDVMFEYPRALDAAVYGRDDYIAPVVRLELGARSDHRSTTTADIQPYADKFFAEEFERPTCRVVAQTLERTLLEKALIIHSALSKGGFREHSSRHAYDLAMMHRAGTMDAVSRDLYTEVAHHKLVFGDDKPASLAPTEGIRLVPLGEHRRRLEADYRSMQPMFFTDPAPPNFDEVVADLSALEGALNLL